MEELSQLQPWLQLFLLYLVAATVGFRGSARQVAPAALLAKAVSEVVNRHWAEVSQHLAALAPREDYLPHLQVAQEYLSRRQAGIYKLETATARARTSTEMKVSRRPPSELPSVIQDFLFSLVVLTVAVVMVVALLVLVWLAQSNALISLALTGLMLGLWLLLRSQRQEPVFVPVEGYLSQWKEQPTTSVECERERRVILMAIAGTGGGLGGGRVGTDIDLDTAEAEPAPSPPGITEIVMTTVEDSMQQVRQEIDSLRRLHRRVFLAIVALWLTVAGVGFSATVFLFEGSWNSAFGGLGFTAVIGGVLWGFLPTVRTSHIALALYESYRIELADGLAEAQAEGDAQRRRALRAEAWSTFRTGLNSLWRQENEAGGLLAKRFATSQGTDVPAEKQ